MNTRKKIAALVGLLSVAALALAGSASAASWNWLSWGDVVATGTAGTCYAPVSAIGYSLINGNDPGRVHAFCYDEASEQFACGSVHGTQVGVRAAGRPANVNQWEYTGATTGQSVGSASGGSALYWHACQRGYYY